MVGSPRLLEPECRSPRQLANALCRYVEMVQVAEKAPYAQSAGSLLIQREYFRRQHLVPV